jgi:hypothetical protein
MEERLPGMQEVGGLNPLFGSIVWFDADELNAE